MPVEVENGVKGGLCRVHAVSAAVMAAGICMVWPLGFEQHCVRFQWCLMVLEGFGGLG